MSAQNLTLAATPLPSPALPGCHTQGETLDEIRANLREAAEGWLTVAHNDALARDAAGEAS